MMLIDTLRAALESQNVRAFLRVLRAGETGQTDDAYRTMVGGGLFEGFEAHPNVVVRVPRLPPSTAAGAYQFLHRTWLECQSALDLPDFGPASQDLAAVFLIHRRGALQDVLAGRIESAITKCNREWASLPGSPYGQPTRSMEMALATYERYGGTLNAPGGSPDQARTADPEVAGASPSPAQIAPPGAAIPTRYPPAGEGLDQPVFDPAPSPTPKGAPMAPIISLLLPSLVAAIPRLGALFGSGSSEVAQRNVKAAEVVFDLAKTALNAANEQDVITKVQSDPAAVAAVTKTVEDNWFALTDAGGGGVAGARAADAAVAKGDMLHSPSFWIGLALLPLVYMIVANLIGLLGSSTWSDDARAGLSGSIVGSIIGGLVGYYFGQTTSRNRTPAP